MTAGRKLYYAPGMISLIGLFIFFRLNIKKFQPQQYAYLSFVVPSENVDEPYYQFSSYWMEKLIKKKKQVQLTLDADEKTNLKKFELIKYEARKLKYTQDTSAVLRIWFTNDITYGTLVQLIDLCYADGHKRFVLLKNSFVIFGEYPPPPTNNDNFICLLCDDVIKIKNDPPGKSFTEKLSAFIKPFSVLQVSGLTILWLLMIFTSIYHKKKIATAFY